MIFSPVTTDPAALASAFCDWWILAGVDSPVAEHPRNWLAAPPVHSLIPATERPQQSPAFTPPSIAVPTPEAEPVVAAPVPMPDNIDAFLDWMAQTDEQPESAFASTMILPGTIMNAPLLVVTEMPGPEDMAAGALLSGSEGLLLDAILRAIDLNRMQVGISSLLLARPTGGMPEDAVRDRATARLQHYVALTQPRRILMLGDGTSRALTPTNEANAAHSTLCINHEEGSLALMPLPALPILLKHPQRKAAAWLQLRQIAALL